MESGCLRLAFLGVSVGMLAAIAYSIPENDRYGKLLEKNGGYSPPESRLPPCMLASLALPADLFWFAWTDSPSIHWTVSIAAGMPFGFGMGLVFLSVFNHLIDAYTIFAASVLAANSLLRLLFGFAFALFTTYMYENLGIHWASCIPAFLALACVPFPFVLYSQGLSLRKYCKFSARSEAFVQSLLQSSDPGTETESDESAGIEHSAARASISEEVEDITSSSMQKEGPPEVQSVRRSPSRLSMTGSVVQRVPTYEANPYSIDREHTRESFK